MTQNEFVERIKAVMAEAKEDGWDLTQIEDLAIESILEWVEQENGS